MKNNATNIIIANLKDLGCEIVYVDETEDQQKARELTKIAEKELPVLKADAKAIKEMKLEQSTVKYFLSNQRARE